MLNFRSALKVKNSLKLKNRIVIPAMASATANVDGEVTKETIEHYERLATSAAGLIIVEYSYVCRSGRSEEHQLAASSDRHIAGLAKLAQAIKRCGAKASLQLTHAGGKTDRKLTEGPLISPSGVPVMRRDMVHETPDVATTADISHLREKFASAAERAYRAGFDGIEIHAAHGYSLNQWLSPLTNQRKDGYGSNLAGRLRLLREIIIDIKAGLPELFISVRIPGQDYQIDGLNLHDSVQIARCLENIGVDIISVSSGLAGWRRPRNKIGEGYLVEDAAAVKTALKIPVIGVGGITSSDFIDQSLLNESFDLAAVGRALLKNPLWFSLTPCLVLKHI